MTDSQRIVVLEELAIQQDKYIKFLDWANESPIRIAAAHGWKCEAVHFEEGEMFREKIKNLRSKVFKP